MSKKGQDNQRGILFQNKVTLLYMLENYKYADFLKIRLEEDQFEDFTLFFNDYSNDSSFFRTFEVKNWTQSLTLNDIRKIIKKELKKGINRYNKKDSFFIIASSFRKECKEQINNFKNSRFFYSYKDFKSAKKAYEQLYRKNPILEWQEEEIIFIQKNVNLVELKEQIIDKNIHEHFNYEQSFFYTAENADNIISRLFRKITEASSIGGELTKQQIKGIIIAFCNAETNKSESYDLTVDLGALANIIQEKLKNEDAFASLNDDRYITPISRRERAVFYIIDQLKNKNFKFKKIKWFFDKILIKDRYMFSSLRLLKKYAESTTLDQEDIESILDFMVTICQYELKSSSHYKFLFDNSKYLIFKILLKLSETNNSDNFKEKVLRLLNMNNMLPDWQTYIGDYNNLESEYKGYATKIIKNVFGITQQGIELIFKKYNLTGIKIGINSQDHHTYYDYIEEFINQNFEKNFPIVIKCLNNQFAILHEKIYGFETTYKGYELSGGGHSGYNNQYQLDNFQWEYMLFGCIKKFYNDTQDWQLLKSFIFTEIDKSNPVFVKRSFIPFLLNHLKQANEQKPENNKFYKALEFILDIKDGLPRTEEVTINILNQQVSEMPKALDNSAPFIQAIRHKNTKNLDNNQRLNNIPEMYLKQIIYKILYKYSEEGITYDILFIQLMIKYIAHGKITFKEDLKRTLLNKEFKKTFIYNRAIRVLESYIENKNIKEFFNEIKTNIDISKHSKLLYAEVAEKPVLSLPDLFNSSSKKDLDNLAGIIRDASLENNYDLLQEVINLMKNDLHGFYERVKASDDLKCVIADKLVQNIIANNEVLAESIIDLCVQDTTLSGESQELNNTVINGEDMPSISSMRAHLCDYSIDSYIRYYTQKKDSKSPEKLKRSFEWIKILMDLTGSMANRIPNFPKPNFYLRFFSCIPLISLSYYENRKKLNQFQKGLGDEIKNFAFTVLEQTEQEIKEKNYNPIVLLNNIGRVFDVMRDLNEKEAKRILLFIKKFDVIEFAHLFIWYALFREKHFLSKGQFNSRYFKDLLKEICKDQTNNFNQPDSMRRCISFTIYKSIKNENKKTQQANPDFDTFEKIKDYWVLLFQNITKDLFFSLNQTLVIILNHSRAYYDDYSEYFFKIIKEVLKNRKESDSDYFLHLDKTFSAVSKHAPDDLIKILFLFLEKGDKVTGWIPFNYEVTHSLLPEIKKQKNIIQKKNMEEAEQELKKYNLSEDIK